MGNTLKQMLVLAALVAAPITMNAQIGEGKAVPGDATWQSIPKAFTSDGKSYLYSGDDSFDDNDNYTCTYTIYNDELEEVKSLTVNAYASEGSFIDLDDNSTPDIEFKITQTLFNADDKYETVQSLYDEEKTCIGFRIVSDDGTELQTVKPELPDLPKIECESDYEIMKINGKFYFVAEGSANYKTYTFFYSITPQTSEIKAVKSIPGSFAGQFSLDGRRQAKLQRGVNIVRQSDGTTKKLLVK